MKGSSVETGVNEGFVRFFLGISRNFSLITAPCGKYGFPLPSKFFL
jgi:hypothetical protein